MCRRKHPGAMLCDAMLQGIVTPADSRLETRMSHGVPPKRCLLRRHPRSNRPDVAALLPFLSMGVHTSTAKAVGRAQDIFLRVPDLCCGCQLLYCMYLLYLGTIPWIVHRSLRPTCPRKASVHCPGVLRARLARLAGLDQGSGQQWHRTPSTWPHSCLIDGLMTDWTGWSVMRAHWLRYKAGDLFG